METKPYIVYINATDKKVHFIIIREQCCVNFQHHQWRKPWIRVDRSEMGRNWVFVATRTIMVTEAAESLRMLQSAFSCFFNGGNGRGGVGES